jgi:hypothetical protein
MFARSERRDFHMPGSDGAVVMVAGAWATLLIFYRVFSRPAGHGYPVGIEWGFLLAFLAAGVLTFAGWRMRAASTPEAPLLRGRGRRRPSERPGGRDLSEDITVLAPSPRNVPRATPKDARPVPASQHDIDPSEEITSVVERSTQPPTGTPQPSPPKQQPKASRKRPRFPPAPSDQLSFEDPAYHSPDDAP